jgi:hypothetical protein
VENTPDFENLKNKPMLIVLDDFMHSASSKSERVAWGGGGGGASQQLINSSILIKL